jgi:UDP-glucose 4-epimerase
MSGKNKLLITGGLGNLGSWLTEYFSHKFDVYVLSKNTLVELNCSYSIIQADITKINDLKLKLDMEFDYCIHTASYNEFFHNNYAKKSLEVNAFGTRNLIEVLKDTKIKNFVYLSTFHVYGSNSGVISEGMELRPKNDYSSTHLFAEYYLKQFYDVYKFPFTILRLTNSYGAPKYKNSTKWYLVLNSLVKRAYEEKKIILDGNGRAVRDFIWAGDVCGAIDQSLYFEPNHVYNLSSGMTFSMMDIAKEVQSVYRRRYNEDIYIKFDKKDKTESLDLKVDNAKINHLLNMKFKNRFREEIESIFDLLESHGE